MKKKIISILAILSILSVTSFSKQYTVYASTSLGSKVIGWIKTVLGLTDNSNGHLSSVSDDYVISMLYNKQLTWNDFHGNASGTITFVPSTYFSDMPDPQLLWKAICLQDTSLYPHTWPSNWSGFDLTECLIDSGYINDDGSGYSLSGFPEFDNATDAQYPLDGVEVITNYGNFNNNVIALRFPYIVNNTLNDIKNAYDENNLVIVSGLQKGRYFSQYWGYHFIRFNTNYIALCKNSSESHGSFFALTYANGQFYSINGFSTDINVTPEIYSDQFAGYYSQNTFNSPFISGDFTFSSDFKSNQYVNSDLEYNSLTFWSNNIPIVYASSIEHGKNYYYWMQQTPSNGILYSTTNINTRYSYDIVNNTNWDQAYNNYITDVSNYYNTTENITNQQITEYITNQTNITNITNNYINNGSVSGNNDGVLANSWLERIYNKLVEIKDAMNGGTDYDPDLPTDDWITDNGILNQIKDYPVSDLFPDIPIDDFLEDTGEFSINAFATALASIATNIVPFCYLAILIQGAGALSAQPKAPKWEIPFKIQRLGIDETLTIDLTDESWEIPHTIWIVCIMAIVCLLLFTMTRKLMMLWSNVLG